MKPNLPTTRGRKPLVKAVTRAFAVSLVLFFSISAFAHSVDNYAATCNASQQYVVTATVSSVNSSSNYRWQWKNTSGSWVCFVNGANTINGNSYNVSGAVFNLTTTPGSLVFTNPTINLQGLEIRMVISDGSGVNPCNLPLGNTWTSSTNHFINVSGTQCGPCLQAPSITECEANVNGTWSVISNCIVNVNQGSSLYLSVNPSTFAAGYNQTWNGPNSYTATGNDAFISNSVTTSNSGVYTITVSNGNCSATKSITVNVIPSTVCTCPGNLVQNPSFENGTTSWSWSGGSLAQGNGAVACGSFSGDLNNTTVNSLAYQTIGTDLAIGTTINATVYAGTHDNTKNNWVGIGFYNASDVLIGSITKVQVDKILANSPAGPQLYSITATVPATTKYTKVGFGGDGSYTKTDQWCVTTTPPVCTGKVTSLYFNKLDGGTDLAITNGAVFTTSQLGSLYNFEAGTTGTVGSVKYTITGPTASSNIENVSPYNGPGTGLAWVPTAGNYSINLKTYNSSDAMGLLCHDTTISIIISNPLKLGNLVWWDKNDNGIKDASEGGWPFGGLTANVYLDNNNDGIADAGWSPISTPVDGNGNYQFTTLAPGSYFVTLTNPYPVDWQKSSVNGGDPDNNIDNDNNGITGTAIIKGQTITLALGTEPGTAADGDDADGNQTYDFGLWKGNGLGDYVFLDSDADGVQDATEIGIPNVTVTLSKGTTVYTTTTDASGYYFFADIYDLANGGYTLTFTTPTGYAPSPANQGGDDTKDSDPVGGVVTGITVPIGTWNHTFDAGFTLASLGDRVWKDDDGDGVQDPGEVGVAGVTVVLLNSAGVVVGTTTTDAFGNYKFSNLLPGNYTVRVTPPANYTLSPKTQGGNTTLDSDFDPITYTTGTVTLTAGQNRTDIDAGLKFNQPQPASVGDRVWLDINGDGIQDAGEPGVSNVLVTLYNNSGVAVASTYTDANGNYLFTEVVPGNYTVGVSLPPAMVFSPNTGATSVANNSDINPANGRTASFTVNAGDQIRYVDAGLKPQTTTNASVGDFVWNDLNKDGVQDAGEPGIAGVTVRLVNATTNTVVATTTTDANGNYVFNDVTPGNYLVEFVTPAGYTTTTKLGTNPATGATDSDADPATGRTASFTLGAGQRISTIDAGYWVTTPPGTAKLGDRVWYDANQNGVQDAGEENVSGVTVTLYNNAGTAIKQATTDQNGNYIFTDLAAGSYTVGFSNLPAGYTFTTQGLGTAATGSDANPATGRTASITLVAGQTNLDADAGIISAQAGTASLGNRVWFDLNNNGLQDAGEVGVQGVTVALLDAAGNPIDKDPVTAGVQPTTTTTNALGEYLFTGLGAGDYRVRFSTLPAGYAIVTKGAGTDRAIDSDGNPLAASTSTTDVVSLSANQERLDIDLGIFNATAPLGQLGDRVWFDANNNGIQDATEQGVPGVSVALLNAAGATIATTVTDKDGLYKFINLADATYSVQFSNLPAGFAFSAKDAGGNDAADSDADVSTGKTGTYTIAGGNSNMTVDAGIYSTRAALGDYVWFDANSDGIQDATEAGIPGVTVILYDAAGVAVASTITDQSGKYFFSNLNPGTYTVGFSTIPGKLVFTAQDAVAAGDGADSDVNPSTGRTGSITLLAGQVNTTVDAGLKPVPTASIGDFVWFDLNRDGIQDAGEPGVPGVIVTLYNSANQPIGSAVTDGDGYYQINNVPAGTGYYVKFSNQPDVTAPWTLQNVGGTGASNNSKVDATGTTGTFSVAEGQKITNIDAGLIKLVNLSGNVWHDVNANTDNLVNNSGAAQLPTPAAPIPANLRAYLVNLSTGLVERVVSINPATGTFSFANVTPNTTYYVLISTSFGIINNPPPASTLPSNWLHTGQKLSPTSVLAPGTDGLNDGRLIAPVGTSDVINVNFGIKLNGGDIVIG